MKIDELIEELEKVKEEHGNLTVLKEYDGAEIPTFKITKSKRYKAVLID